MQSSISRMQPLDENTIASLEDLCQLRCTPHEREEILRSLSRVLDYIHLLNEIDSQNVPTCNFVSRAMVKRLLSEDEPDDLLSSALFFSNVPDRTDGLVRVPTVLKSV